MVNVGCGCVAGIQAPIMMNQVVSGAASVSQVIEALGGMSAINAPNADCFVAQRLAIGEKTDLFKGLLEAGVTQFRGAILSRSILSETDLSGRDFTDADFSAARLETANLSSALFVGANLEGCFLVGADLGGANFEGARLVNAVLRGLWQKTAVISKETNFARADLSSATLRSLDFSYVNFAKAILKGANLTDAIFQYANLVDTNFEDASASSVDFSYAQLAGASFVRACIFDSIYDFADLRGADLSDTTPNHYGRSEPHEGSWESNSRGDVWNPSYSEPLRVNCSFEHADLSDASFRNASLACSKFKGAITNDGTDFTNADMRSVRGLNTGG